ncbi:MULTISPECIES: type III secretion system cytoplasmic ring protein SctQ [Mesorhizobium]|uniref:Translocation protein in type III secretion system HrcQ n=1 Tax=Mesorhizobium japonicum (strain LMG 29417 / CECT 9101 / MAFF 303099) TaxID=266835 RepID=Q989P0_RHILO|nr:MULTISPECIES: type III secretion system cytoplasmic ring protein SctQ [Mesorhizobium]BAB52654.1 translocation protein in type III secretion system; HrcQ [Mesorhizobium japonicum MAFF 303099]BCH18961.1 putative translocation protein Y4yK [Mesorhizobium sp. L-2-11]
MQFLAAALVSPPLLEPALTLSHEVASWLNDTAASRGPFQTRINDVPLSVRVAGLVWQENFAAIPMLDCICRVGAETVVLSISRSLVEGLIATVQNGLTFPSEPTASLIVELALEPLIARLEYRTQLNVQLVRVFEAATLAPYLELDIDFGPVSGKGRLFLFSPLDGLVPSAFRALGELFGQLPRQPRGLLSDLPIVVAGEIGTLHVPAAILRKACAGDALLPDLAPFGRGEIALSLGQLWASADLEGDQLVLHGPFRPRSYSLENAHMTQLGSQLGPTEDLDDVEIMLVFECGRWPIPLGELRSAGEGHIFELGRPIQDPVDILANGQCIGRGDIVRIGDTLGIRLRGRLGCND